MATHALSTEQKTGAASIIGLLASIAGFIAVFAGHPFIGLFLALGAIVLGTVGFLMAASPRVSGGVMGIVAVVLGIIGIGLSVLGMLGVMLF